LNCVIEMFQRRPEDLKCIDEHYREFFQNDHLDKLNKSFKLGDIL